MVLLVVLQQLHPFLLLLPLGEVLLQDLPIVLRPALDGKLRDLRLAIAEVSDGPRDLPLALLPGLGDLPREASEPGDHLPHLLLLQPPPQIVDDVSGVEVRYRGAPARANALHAVDQDHGDDGAVPPGLDRHAVLVQKVQDLVVRGREDGPGDRGQAGVDVTRRGRILASLEPGTELALWDQEVDVVGPHEVLGHAHDGLRE
mmetsp:Transcript_18175/g.31716  ORF Transcript_18175/g.31716 Transcript_18175/m.31716 type:complete len:202 (-) Transcript_18175:1214-1819(-)